ncbi:MAG: PaaI family thioesterase [Victivallaceae bacterium]|nr:PaaI family thioesterase [Victivallaceae bacterium]
MSNGSALIDFLNEKDTFCRSNGIVLTKVEEGHAEAELTIDANKLNAGNMVQGGAIFTLADFAFAGAANSYEGLRAVAMNASISFLRPGTGSKLFAVAEVVSKGKRSCLVETSVRDEAQKLVAKITTTGFFI